jgi:hypothetical protein
MHHKDHLMDHRRRKWLLRVAVIVLALLSVAAGSLGVFGLVSTSVEQTNGAAIGVNTSQSAQEGDDAITSATDDQALLLPPIFGQSADGVLVSDDAPTTSVITLTDPLAQSATDSTPQSSNVSAVSGIGTSAAASAIPEWARASLRVFAASSNTPRLNLVIDGTTVQRGLSFGQASLYHPVSSGVRHRVDLVLTNNPNHVVSRQFVTLGGNRAYTLALSGLQGARLARDRLHVRLLRDVNATTSSGARVRVVNLAVNRPSADIYTRHAQFAWTRRFVALGAGGQTGYVTLLSGTKSFAVGNHTSGFALNRTFQRLQFTTLSGNATYTLWVLGGQAVGTGGNTIGARTRVVLTRDAIA